MLVGEGVSQLVHESKLLHLLRCPCREVEAAGFEVVERDGLLRQDVNDFALQVEVIANEAEQLEKQLLPADFLRIAVLGDAGFDELPDLVACQQLPRDRLANLEAGDLAQTGEHAVDLREEFGVSLVGTLGFLAPYRISDRQHGHGDCTEQSAEEDLT